MLFIEAIGERRGRGLVDQAQNFEASDAAGIFCGLALRVVEVRGHGDDGLGNLCSEEAFGVAFELAENESRNFRRRECLFAKSDAQDFTGLQVLGQTEGEELQLFMNVVNPASHEALDRVDGALRRLGEVFAGGVADDRLIVLVERHDRRDEIRSIIAGNHDRALPLHEGHERIRGAQVDADDAIRCHLVIL